MSRSSLTAACLTASILLAPLAIAAAQQPAAAPAAAPAALTPADAAPFLGDWTLNMETPGGPAAIALSIKNDAGKIAGEISSDMMPKTPVTDITKAGANLVLKYTFNFDGNPVPVVVTLVPAGEKMTANLDFAGGMFSMDGTATKK